MKRYLFILAFILVHNSTYSQNYMSMFGNVSTAWKIPYYNLDVNEVDSLFEDGIIVLGGFAYRKIYNNHINYFWGYLREDTIVGKVWFQGWNDSERLIMDMGLSVGDSFYVSGYINPGWKLVDSVYIQNGLRVVRLNQDNESFEKLKFIEGVGPNASFTYQKPGWGNGSYTICVHKDSSLFYVTNNPLFIGCGIVAGVSENESAQTMLLYPNPSNGLINISAEGIKEIKVLNVLGELIFKSSLKNSQSTIDMTGFVNGIYFIEIIMEDGIVRKTIVKE